jgi:hypothetical protein
MWARLWKVLGILFLIIMGAVMVFSIVMTVLRGVLYNLG